MKRNMYLMLAVAMVVAGCSQTETPEQGESGKVEIKLSSEVPTVDASATRTPVDGTTFTNHNVKVLLTDRTGVYKAESGKLFYDGTMTFNGSTAASFNTTPQYYPADNSQVYLCGLSPADSHWGIDGTTGQTATYTLDGKTDLLAAGQIDASKSDNTGKVLAFKHLLTKLIVKAKAADASAISKWGAITGITLKAVNGVSVLNNKVAVTLADGTAAVPGAFSNTTGTVGFYKATEATAGTIVCTDNAIAVGAPCDALTTTECAVGYSLIAPVAYSSDKVVFKFDITTETGSASDVEATITKTETHTQGKVCTVTLNFKLKDIQASASVEDWTDGGTTSKDVE